jgi:hypothetical protein
MLVGMLALSVVPVGAQTVAGTTTATLPASGSEAVGTPAPASVTSNLNLYPALAPKPAAAKMASDDSFHRFEVFAGYSFLNNNSADTTQLVHGYAASVKFNLNRKFGILADFSGHNGSDTNRFGEDQDVDQYYFVFGPEVSHSFGKARISGHVLVGLAKQHASINCSGCTPFSMTEHNFAAGAGGSFDWMFSDRWGWRVLQFDYLTSIFGGFRVNNVRGETGIIVRFK